MFNVAIIITAVLVCLIIYFLHKIFVIDSSFVGEKLSSVDHLDETIKVRAQELYSLVEKGKVSREVLENEAVPEEGRHLYEAYLKNLSSNTQIKQLGAIKEKAYYEEC